MTRHLGSLASFPLSAYIGPAGREISGRAAHEKVFQSYYFKFVCETVFSGK